MRRRAAAFIAVSLLALARVAAAQQAAPAAPPPPPPDPSDNTPPEVRIIGSKADSLQRIPGSATVITQKQIENTQPYDTAEMLRQVPGLQVRQEDGGGFRLDIGIRGLDPGRARHLLVLEDGVPVAVNPYAESDLYYIPPMERMRGVEVVKGSGSILFGPQTIGGVINFFTITPPTHPIAAVEVWGGDYSYKKALAMYGDANGPLRYVVQVFHKEGDGFRAEGFANTDAFVKAALDTSSRGEATLKIAFHDDEAYSDDLGLTTAMFQADPRRPTLAPADHISQQNYSATLVHEQRFTDDTSLKTLAYGYMNNRILEPPELDQRPDRRHAVHQHRRRSLAAGRRHLLPEQRHGAGALVSGRGPRAAPHDAFLTGPAAHTLDTGARVLTETARYDQREGDSPVSLAGDLVNQEFHTTYAFAGYIQDRVALTDKLMITPGFRLENATFYRDITRVSTGTTTGVDAFIHGSRVATGLIPGIGIIYGTKLLHVFAGVHVGWSPPRIVDAVTARGTPSQVDAEQSYNYELGMRVATPRWLRAEGTLFYSWFTNQVVQGSNSDAAQLVNGGNTQHYGVEAVAQLAVGKLLKLPSMQIDVGGRYTFVHATLLDPPYSGNMVPYSPMHTAGATLDVNDASGIGGQASWYYVSSQFVDEYNTVAANPSGTVGEIPAYNVVDFNAHYHHKKTGLTAKLLVKSALDQIYISERRPNGIHAAGFREIMLGLRWDYEKVPKPQ